MFYSIKYRVKDVVILINDVNEIASSIIKKDTKGKIIDHPENGVDGFWQVTFTNHPHVKIHESNFIKAYE